MRSLSPEETALWARVASTIRPLSRDVNGGTKPRQPPPVIRSANVVRAAPPEGAVAPARKRRGPGSTLDSSWDRRLRSGSVEPDRTVDLHGMSLDTAWRAIDEALERAIGRGDRLMLLITGHHRPGEPPLRRGAIRAAVYDWLAASRHAGDIAAVRAAHRRHGGAGSLYIILRRKAASR